MVYHRTTLQLNPRAQTARRAHLTVAQGLLQRRSALRVQLGSTVLKMPKLPWTVAKTAVRGNTQTRTDRFLKSAHAKTVRRGATRLTRARHLVMLARPGPTTPRRGNRPKTSASSATRANSARRLAPRQWPSATRALPENAAMPSPQQHRRRTVSTVSPDTLQRTKQLQYVPCVPMAKQPRSQVNHAANHAPQAREGLTPNAATADRAPTLAVLRQSVRVALRGGTERTQHPQALRRSSVGTSACRVLGEHSAISPTRPLACPCAKTVDLGDTVEGMVRPPSTCAIAVPLGATRR